MSSPGASQAIQRPDLRNAVVEEWNVSGEAANFAADQVALRVDVPFAAGTVKRIPREAATKDPNTANRGPDGSYSEIEWGDESFTYITQERGLEAPVDANMAAQAALYYDAEKAAARLIMSKLMRAHEIEVAAAVMNTTTFTGTPLTTNISTAWSTAASATPIDDVAAARAKVRANCGRNANALIVSWKVWEKLINVAQILNRINGGARSDAPAIAQMANVAQILQLDKIIVAGSIKDSAKQGQAFTGTDLWSGTQAMVAYLNPSAGLYDINLCNCYNWEGDGGSYNWTIERYWDEKKRRWCIRGRRQVGVKVEYAECGHLLTNASA